MGSFAEATYERPYSPSFLQRIAISQTWPRFMIAASRCSSIAREYKQRSYFGPEEFTVGILQARFSGACGLRSLDISLGGTVTVAARCIQKTSLQEVRSNTR